MEFIQFLPVGAIEYSLIYMLGGGGLIGAFVIFLIARMLRRQSRTVVLTVPDLHFCHQEHFELWQHGGKILEMPNLIGNGSVFFDYRVVIDSLIRKLGDFANYRQATGQ